MTRGRCGSLNHFRMTFAFTTPRRFSRRTGEYPMKQNVMLTIASLLSILLLTLHITDDIVRGISKAESLNITLVVRVGFPYWERLPAERGCGYVIMRLVMLFAAGIAGTHKNRPH